MGLTVAGKFAWGLVPGYLAAPDVGLGALDALPAGLLVLATIAYLALGTAEVDLPSPEAAEAARAVAARLFPVP